MGYRFKLSDKELLRELLHILKVNGDIDHISKQAIKEFGGIRGVFEGRIEELKKINGFTPTVIKRLKTISSLFKEIIKTETYTRASSQNMNDLSYFKHTSPKVNGDCLRLLFLDENHTILRDFIFKVGSGSHLTFYFREIVSEVLNAGVSNLVLIHHKISASAQPLKEDTKRYQEIRTGFKALDINLVDYLIIAQDKIYSFKGVVLNEPVTCKNINQSVP